MPLIRPRHAPSLAKLGFPLMPRCLVPRCLLLLTPPNRPSIAALNPQAAPLHTAEMPTSDPRLSPPPCPAAAAAAASASSRSRSVVMPRPHRLQRRVQRSERLALHPPRLHIPPILQPHQRRNRRLPRRFSLRIVQQRGPMPRRVRHPPHPARSPRALIACPVAAMFSAHWPSPSPSGADLDPQPSARNHSVVIASYPPTPPVLARSPSAPGSMHEQVAPPLQPQHPGHQQAACGRQSRPSSPSIDTLIAAPVDPRLHPEECATAATLPCPAPRSAPGGAPSPPRCRSESPDPDRRASSRSTISRNRCVIGIHSTRHDRRQSRRIFG